MFSLSYQMEERKNHNIRGGKVLKKKDQQLTLFDVKQSRQPKREKYLKFRDVEITFMKCRFIGEKCIDCQEEIRGTADVYHIYHYGKHSFSAFMCEKCFEVFKTNEVEI